ncbi:MAG: hypothetical protein ABI700_14315, partial [Chloroflexota bacterium]
MNSDGSLLSGSTHQPKNSALLPVTLQDGLVPLTDDGRYVPNHLDTNRVVHWFSVVETQDEL